MPITNALISADRFIEAICELMDVSRNDVAGVIIRAEAGHGGVVVEIHKLMRYDALPVIEEALKKSGE